MLYINLSDDSYSIAKEENQMYLLKCMRLIAKVLLRKQILTFILDSQSLTLTLSIMCRQLKLIFVSPFSSEGYDMDS